MFNRLISYIFEYAGDGFYIATKKLSEFIFSTDNFIDILSQIGTIPEIIPHDSTEEKLFAKVSDAVLSRTFRELGLKSKVLSERADSADVIAQSDIHGYTLVADAKAFRLSRTAKNQKDFKIGALSMWRKTEDYAVLCSPYFQYPSTQSQIYAQAVDNNVCLLSWEHLMCLLKHRVKESKTLNLSTLWNFSETIAHTRVVAENKRNFISEFNTHYLSTTDLTQRDFENLLTSCVNELKNRADKEKAYWEEERKTIMLYSHEQAITELIKSKKIDEKINRIKMYIRRVSRD